MILEKAAEAQDTKHATIYEGDRWTMLEKVNLNEGKSCCTVLLCIVLNEVVCMGIDCTSESRHRAENTKSTTASKSKMHQLHYTRDFIFPYYTNTRNKLLPDTRVGCRS